MILALAMLMFAVVMLVCAIRSTSLIAQLWFSLWVVVLTAALAAYISAEELPEDIDDDAV